MTALLAQQDSLLSVLPVSLSFKVMPPCIEESREVCDWVRREDERQ
jgi:saccharopine dehydrogenase-like NADP-dependent oxidoreductase